MSSWRVEGRPDIWPGMKQGAWTMSMRDILNGMSISDVQVIYRIPPQGVVERLCDEIDTLRSRLNQQPAARRIRSFGPDRGAIDPEILARVQQAARREAGSLKDHTRTKATDTMYADLYRLMCPDAATRNLDPALFSLDETSANWLMRLHGIYVRHISNADGEVAVEVAAHDSEITTRCVSYLDPVASVLDRAVREQAAQMRRDKG